jgi:hypothetical protein
MATEKLKEMNLEELARKKIEAQILKLDEDTHVATAKAQGLERSIKAQEQSVANKAQAASSEGWRKWLATIFTGIKNFFGIFYVILRDLSPYIALAIVIMTLILISRHASPPPPRRVGNMNMSIKPKWYDFVFPSYKISTLFSFGEPKSIQRPIETYGRCDNKHWRQVGSSGESGLCTRTSTPRDVTWTFDIDKMPDLNNLPETLKNKVTKNNQRLQVYIPWAQQGPFYVPQCSRAYFLEKDASNNEQKVDASYLFQDKGLSCQRIVKASTLFNGQYRSSSETSSVQIFDTPNQPPTPQCHVK